MQKKEKTEAEKILKNFDSDPVNREAKRNKKTKSRLSKVKMHV